MIVEGKPCANCGTLLQGEFCHSCGQKATEINKPFWWIAGEFLDSVFSYDSRTLRTIWLLFADPGEFTRLYNSGRRASVLPPFRTFIVATIVFFLALQMTGVAFFRMEPTTVSLKGMSAEERKQITRALSGEGKIVSDDSMTSITYDFLVPQPPGGFKDALTAEQKLQMEELRKEIQAAEAKRDEGGPPTWLTGIAKRASLGFEHAIADPIRFNSAMNVWLPRVMLFLVPVFALLLALMHWRPRAYYIENLIFSLHIHTVAFVGFSLVVVFVALFQSNTLAWAMLPILGVYLYMAMIRVYGRGYLWTGLKYLVLLVVYGFVLMTSLSIAFLLALTDT
jgi:hypothetical protein